MYEVCPLYGFVKQTRQKICGEAITITTIAQYTNALKQSSAAVARKMGVHFAGSDMPTRVMIRVILGLFATLIKLLVDKGVLTDAEVQAALTAAAGDAYVQEPQEPEVYVPPPEPM